MLKSSTLLLSFLTFSTITFSQGVGDLDPSFANAGKYTEDFGFHDNLTDVKELANGKILTVGTAINSAFSGQLLIKRLNADGSSDNTFSDDGTVIINDYTESYAYECFELADGKILVAGSTANQNYQFSLAVFKLDVDGSFDTSFGVNGHAVFSLVSGDTQAYDMAVDADGKIVVAGNTAVPGEFGAPIICRLNADGTMDTSFGSNGVVTITPANDDNIFRNVAIDSQGRILAAGHWGQGITGDGQINNDAVVVRVLADGTMDSSFGTDGKLVFSVNNYIDDLFSMDLSASDEIYVCGYTMLDDASFNGLIAKIDENGSLVNGFDGDGIVEFNAGPQDVFADIKLFENQLYVAGSSGGFLFENRDFLLARYDVDGAIDESFGTSGATITTIFNSFDDANGMAIQSDEKILVAGKGNNSASSNNDAAIIRYFNNANVGVNEMHASSLQVFPSLLNSGDVLKAQWKNESFDTCVVLNSFGQCVAQMNIASQKGTIEMTTQGWAAGMYHLMLLEKGSVVTSQKVIVH